MKKICETCQYWHRWWEGWDKGRCEKLEDYIECEADDGFVNVEYTFETPKDFYCKFWKPKKGGKKSGS